MIGDDQVFIDYARNDIPSLHEKNLFELGEDRMLTTLLLQRFPGMNLSFVPEAICWTIVPHTMSILLSQRRRWINSTFHNMYELLKVQTMCGLCMFSMKTVVIMDLVVTMILPASLIYVAYLTYLFISEPETIDQFVLIMYAASFCLQTLSFLLRSRYDYLWWFFIFVVLGIPVFYFILPIYAFTHMDDFSWGKTRQVGTTKEEATGKDEDEDDDSDVQSTSSSGSDTKSVYSRGREGEANGPPSVRSKHQPSVHSQSFTSGMPSYAGQSYGTGMPSHAQSYGMSYTTGPSVGQSFTTGMPSTMGNSYTTGMPSQGGSYTTGMPSQGGNSYTTGMPSAGQSFTTGMPSQGTYASGMPSMGQQSYSTMPSHHQQGGYGGYPPQHAQYDHGYSDHQSYAGEQSLGASTIQTNFDVVNQARRGYGERMVAIPDGFSVNREDGGYASYRG